MNLIPRAAVLLIVLCLIAAAPYDSWMHGVPVQQSGSHIEIASVTSRARSDFDPYTRLPGPIFFDDCIALINRGVTAAVHVQVVFVGVDQFGNPRRKQLPLDVRRIMPPGAKEDGEDLCRYHVYPNADRGYRLAAWVNEVDFSDGTSWHAPPVAKLIPLIQRALADHPNS